MHRIACIGEAMIELIAGPDGAARLSVAGDTYNTAVYLKHLLGARAQVHYVTALGDDPFSGKIMRAIKAYGLDTDLIETRTGGLPGLYAIDTDDTGERRFSYWRSASAARTLFGAAGGRGPERLAGFDLIYLSGIALAILPPAARLALLDWLGKFRASGGRVAYDSNYRPSLWETAAAARKINARAWQLTDIALPSLDDELALHGDADEGAVRARLGRRLGALKRGARGPVNLESGAAPDGLRTSTKVVDTTAAGDSFNAGVLAGLAQGAGLNDAIRAGHDLAVRVIGHPGAIMIAAPAPGTGPQRG